MLSFDPETLRLVIVQMIVLILSVAVHEFGHALVADRLGDDTPRRQGRVTLNPIAHMDPIGTLALPLFLLLSGSGLGFGWGKPVYVNPVAFSRRFRMRTGHMFVAAAGPMMNLLFAAVISLLLVVLLKTDVLRPNADFLTLLTFRAHLEGFDDVLVANMGYAVLLNIVLAVFNLVPAPPLDGGAVLEGLLPDRSLPAYEAYKQYSLFVVLAVVAIPRVSQVFLWPAGQLFRGWTALIGLS